MPSLLPEILRTLFEIVLFEECSNQWSLSRPMLSLILVRQPWCPPPAVFCTAVTDNAAEDTFVLTSTAHSRTSLHAPVPPPLNSRLG